MTIALGCRHTVEEPTFAIGDELGSEHVVHLRHAAPTAARVRSPSVLAASRFRMQQRFDDLRQVEALLVAGRLADARSLAFVLSRPIHEADAQWPAESARLSDAVLALSRANTIEEAFRIEATIAEACAGCHVRAGAQLAGPTSRSLPPPAGPTSGDRMARHRWATDQLAKGVISASDQPWREALHMFEATPFEPPTDPRGHRVQALARTALHAPPTLPERAKVYGELLATCAACHAGTRRGDQ